MILFFYSIQVGRKPLGIEGQRSTLPGEEKGPPTMKLSAEHGVEAGIESTPQVAPSLLVPTSPLCLVLPCCPVGHVLAGDQGSSGGNGGLSPYEAHVAEGWGGCLAASVCSWLTGSCWEQIQGILFPG